MEEASVVCGKTMIFPFAVSLIACANAFAEKLLRPSSLTLITFDAPYLYNTSEESVGFTEIAVTVSPA